MKFNKSLFFGLVLFFIGFGFTLTGIFTQYNMPIWFYLSFIVLGLIMVLFGFVIIIVSFYEDCYEKR